MSRTTDPNEEARAQYSTAGAALLVVGALGLLLGCALMALGLQPPFLEPEALAVTGALVGTVGAVMRVRAT